MSACTVSFQASITLGYKLALKLHHSHQQVDSCGEEIAMYVSNHDNWPHPILPGGGDCTDMEFDPGVFDHQGNFWQCFGQSDGKLFLLLIVTIQWVTHDPMQHMRN